MKARSEVLSANNLWELVRSAHIYISLIRFLLTLLHPIIDTMLSKFDQRFNIDNDDFRNAYLHSHYKSTFDIVTTNLTNLEICLPAWVTCFVVL